MRWLVVPALFVLLAVPAPAAVPDPLLRAATARDRVAYSGEQLLATWDARGAHVAWVHVQHDPATGTRLVYRVDAEANRRRVVWHLPQRTVEYELRTRSGRWYRADQPEVSAQTQLSWLLQNYEVATSPSQALGRPALRLRILPRHPGRPRADLRVDAGTGVVLRSERVSPDGRTRELVAFVNFNPRPVGWMRSWRLPADLTLRQEPSPQPATVQQITERLGRRPPDLQLPPGFFPLTGYLLEPASPTVRRLYSDGLSSLVLSLRPALSAAPPAGSRRLDRARGPAWLHSMGMRHALYWASQGWSFTLAGDLSPEVLLQVADTTGVQPPPSPLDGVLQWLRRLLGADADAWSSSLRLRRVAGRWPQETPSPREE
jgi:hypothetical protein